MAGNGRMGSRRSVGASISAAVTAFESSETRFPLEERYNNDEERMMNISDDVRYSDPEAWKKLMDHFSSLELQKVSQSNSKNRSKLTTKHTCGTRSYAEVEEMTGIMFAQQLAKLQTHKSVSLILIGAGDHFMQSIL